MSGSRVGSRTRYTTPVRRLLCSASQARPQLPNAMGRRERPGSRAGAIPSEWARSLRVFKDEGDFHVHLVSRDVTVLDQDVHILDPGPSTFRSVEVARLTPCLMASSKPVSETALSSVTRAADICSPLPWLALCFPGHLLPAPEVNRRSATWAKRP